MTNYWDDCPGHEWKEHPDSMYSNDLFTELRCIHCGVPAELDHKTKKIYYPAT